MTDELDKLRPEVREALKSIEFACTVRYSGEDEYAIIRAELLRLAAENARLQYEVESRGTLLKTLNNTIQGWESRAEKAEAQLECAKDALFQISVRLGAEREPDMDDMSWHTDMMARAQFLTNAEAELAALKARIDGSRHAFLGQNMDRITFLAEDIGPVGEYALVKVEE